MKYLLSTLAIAITLSAQSQSALTIRKEKLRQLGFLIGKWNVEAERTNSKGEVSVEKDAIISFAYDMDSTAIRNERHFRNNTFYEFIFYNTSRNMFEFIPLEYGIAAAPRPWMVDLNKKIYQYKFSSFDAEKKITIETTVTLRQINPDKLIETFEGIAFETGEKAYHSKLTYTRLQ